MVYKLKEISPTPDHENSDLVLMGAVPYEDKREQSQKVENRAGYVRFVELWTSVWGLLQDPIRDDSEGIDGHTGYRNTVLDNDGTKVSYALGFILSANYGKSDVYMKITAMMRRIYDKDAARVDYESKVLEVRSEDASFDDDCVADKLTELEQLLSLYVAAPAYEDQN